MYCRQSKERRLNLRRRGGAFRSIEEIYSLAYSIVSPRLPVFSRYLWLQHPRSTFEMVSGANSSAIHGQQFFLYFFHQSCPSVPLINMLNILEHSVDFADLENI